MCVLGCMHVCVCACVCVCVCVCVCIVHILKDMMIRMNLSIANCRGQCYNEAANMAGHRSGVAAQILSVESRATYTHCYRHALSLAASDSIKKNKILRDTLDAAFEISKLLKYTLRSAMQFSIG